MKRILFTLFLIIFFKNAYSQDYWAPDEAEWYYSLPNELGNPLYSFEKYFILKDSVIDGRNCKIVKSEHFTEIMYEENNKVYYEYGNKFHLIYDYSALIGDTISFEFKSYSPESTIIDTTYNVNCVVNKIDTINVNSKLIKEYFTSIIPIDSLNHLVWPLEYNYREKVGYEYDFLFVLSIPTIDFMHNLRCYNDDELNFVTDWWIKQAKSCDFSLLSTMEYKNNNEKHYIFPNPVYDEITINTEQLCIEENNRISIIDYSGKICYEGTIVLPFQTINIKTLPPSTYYLYILNNRLYYKPFKIIKL